MGLKDLYSPQFLTNLGTQLHQVAPTFDVTRFCQACLTEVWSDLKLMERRDVITTQMHAQLPASFSQAAAILRQVGPNFIGLAAVCLPNYVAVYGLDHWQVAMTTLAVLTKYSSAEFAIRPFLKRYPIATAQQMQAWAQSADADVRRLASEGMRPRLPWGTRLPQYMADPTPVLAVLHQLFFDKSDYVQKSVANNLNDISKDHPGVVIAFAQQYWSQAKSGDWILRRGLRTLFKQGNPAVLALLGYDITAAEKVTGVTLQPESDVAVIGGLTTVAYTVRAPETMPVYLGYRVGYVRQNGTTTAKDFFVKRTTLPAGQLLQGVFKLKWQQLTTRRLYPGAHRVALLVNTRVVAESRITLEWLSTINNN